MLDKSSQIGIAACSNGQQESYRDTIQQLLETIEDTGITPVCSSYLYEDGSYFSGTGKERADALNNMFSDENIGAIFDISGGDVANEVLEYLDYDMIKSQDKIFYGYSDVTTVINAIYALTGRMAGLYQIRNLVYEQADMQKKSFVDTIINGGSELTNIHYNFVQEHYMEGVVIGGNIRCFLKLAGTKYMPDFNGKILLLEGLNTTSAQAATYLCQLKQLGAFEKINGILLGTFTKLDMEVFVPSIEELVQRYAGCDIPVARTFDIGHGAGSKCIYIGKEMKLEADYDITTT